MKEAAETRPEDVSFQDIARSRQQMEPGLRMIENHQTDWVKRLHRAARQKGIERHEAEYIVFLHHVQHLQKFHAGMLPPCPTHDFLQWLVHFAPQGQISNELFQVMIHGVVAEEHFDRLKAAGVGIRSFRKGIVMTKLNEMGQVGDQLIEMNDFEGAKVLFDCRFLGLSWCAVIILNQSIYVFGFVGAIKATNALDKTNMIDDYVEICKHKHAMCAIQTSEALRRKIEADDLFSSRQWGSAIGAYTQAIAGFEAIEIEYFDEGIDMTKEDGRYAYKIDSMANLAECYFNQMRYRQCMEMVVKVLEEDHENFKALWYYGKSLVHQTEFIPALTNLEKALNVAGVHLKQVQADIQMCNNFLRAQIDQILQQESPYTTGNHADIIADATQRLDKVSSLEDQSAFAKLYQARGRAHLALDNLPQAHADLYRAASFFHVGEIVRAHGLANALYLNDQTGVVRVIMADRIGVQFHIFPWMPHEQQQQFSGAKKIQPKNLLHHHNMQLHEEYTIFSKENNLMIV